MPRNVPLPNARPRRKFLYWPSRPETCHAAPVAGRGEQIAAAEVADRDVRAVAECGRSVDLALLADLEVRPREPIHGRHALSLVADGDEKAHASPGKRPSKAACFDVR